MWINFYCYLDFLFYFFKGTKNYIGESYLIFMGPTSKINLKYICFLKKKKKNYGGHGRTSRLF